MKNTAIVRIQGGLGNQMFQYAYAYALSKRNGCKFLLDISTFERYKVRRNHLSEFKKLPPYAKKKDIPFYERYQLFHKDLVVPRVIKSICWRLNPYDYREKSKGYDENFAKLSKGYIIGYFQSERYFKKYEDEIRGIFKFSDKTETVVRKFIKERNIDVKNSVAISVRRGDFGTDGAHYLIPLDWYLEAYKKYFSGKKILIFSDDIQWCKENFGSLKHEFLEIGFVDNLSAIDGLCLMSKFHYFIISNSTFSWWGAYLPKFSDKVVVRPDLEFDKKVKGADYYRDHYPEQRIPFEW